MTAPTHPSPIGLAFAFLVVVIGIASSQTSPSSPFGPSMVYPQTCPYGRAYPGDIDGDGDDDVINVSGSTAWIVWNNYPGPHFLGPALSLAGPVLDAAIEDIDADGDGDFLFLMSNQLEIALNLQTTLSLSFLPIMLGVSRLQFVDIDSDGLRDIVLDGATSWSRNLGAGAFGSFQSFPVPAAPMIASATSIAKLVGDFDNDLDQDLAYLAQVGTSLAIEIQVNDGTGVFVPQPVQLLPSPAGLGTTLIDHAVTGDFDGDQDCDIVVFEYPGEDLFGYARLLWNTGNLTIAVGPLAASSPFLLGQRSLVCDIDQNGVDDLISSNASSAQLVLFDSTGPASGVLSLPSSHARLANIDGNHVPDLVYFELGNPIVLGQCSLYVHLNGSTPIPNPINLGACANGNLVDGLGSPINILSVNASAGLPHRRVDVPINAPFTIALSQPPTNPFPAPFVIYGLIGVPSPTDSVTLPFNLGSMCFTPFTANPNFPGAFILANSYYPADPDALLPSTPAPWNYTKVTGIHFPFQFTLQGLISQDPATVRVTNGVILNIQ